MVFLGTVTEALVAADNGWIQEARMRIDRAYKGVSEKTLILFDNGMCNGPVLEVGEQYLMYTHRIGRGLPVPSRGCSRSRNVKDAEEDLKYLNGLGTAAPTGTIYGQVSVRSDGIGEKDQPAPGAVVEIRGAKKTLTTAADGEGHYSFDGLKPARYGFNVTKPGFRALDFLSRQFYGPPYAVEARSCLVVDMTLRKNWPGMIGGRVTRSDGTPATAGIPFMLIRVEGTGKDERSDAVLDLTAKTDDKGEYSFRGAAPGRYKVAMNLYGNPTPRFPYPTIYWPDASAEATASEVEISDHAISQQCDFRLPPELRSTVVKGIVLLRDGKPAKGARVTITVISGPFGVHNGYGNPITDIAGHFSFTAMEGSNYSLTAAKTDEGWLVSDAIPFSLAEGSQSITLTLVPRATR
ncbi:MAG: carboxypeptidase-like regulatory domain-containing protein [Bryobacteraceae bacterium]|jgi:hypothetical protein